MNTLKTNPSPTSSAVLAVLTPEREEKRQHGRRFKDIDESMFTLTSQDIHGILEVSNCFTDGWLMDTSHHDKPMCEYRIRRLTPIECERLQGFPDNWTRGVSDSARYRVLGKAVTTNVVKHLGELIMSSFTNHSVKEESD